MAVYSPINVNELSNYLKQYDLGKLINFEGILEGIENTNYKISTSKKDYILTIFEKRVKSEDLPFFVHLKNHLYNKKFLCPKPISNKSNQSINLLNKKNCLITSYLAGKKTEYVTADHCEQVGIILSSLHQKTSDFHLRRENTMNYIQWKKLFLKCQTTSSKEYIDIIKMIDVELEFLNNNWPNNLHKGIIHADVFQDNVFFINN